jgi:hypothetical protein
MYFSIDFLKKKSALKNTIAGVAKLVDASDLGSDAARYGGSSPSARTHFKNEYFEQTAFHFYFS